MAEAPGKLTILSDPSILILKSLRRLELYEGSDLVRLFDIVLGSSPIGDKEVEGDGRTPEGEFYIFTRNPESRYHLSLAISYPNRAAAVRGLNNGIISREEHDAIAEAERTNGRPPQNTRLGGEIYIHGGGTACDWTDGCIALSDDEMTVLFEAIPVRTPVTILK